MTEAGKEGRLSGKRAIVTGGSRGIGAAIVEAFAREGAAVAFCHVNDGAEAVLVTQRAAAVGKRPVSMECDVSSPAEVEAFVAFAEGQNGPTDILVNNAGISISHRFEDISVEEFDRVLGVHLRGTFLMARAVYPGMTARRYGRIVNISSQLALKGGVELAHYCAAKAGILGLTKSLATEAAPFNVLVNAIAPGPVETGILYVLSDEWRKRKMSEMPIGRFGETHEITPAAIFLASDDCSYMVGATLHVNGGDLMA
ncbi:MAG: SDR family NAD(P)-dependent oxidoreductase [Parvibaculaceae bacterium]